jgi:NAD(P)-dependent dehydrogenase (short-subunit alcohol dehydrogenase family)
MDLKLTNKSALVSGSTKGIGFAIATALARGFGKLDVQFTLMTARSSS